MKALKFTFALLCGSVLTALIFLALFGLTGMGRPASFTTEWEWFLGLALMGALCIGVGLGVHRWQCDWESSIESVAGSGFYVFATFLLILILVTLFTDAANVVGITLAGIMMALLTMLPGGVLTRIVFNVLTPAKAGC